MVRGRLRSRAVERNGVNTVAASILWLVGLGRIDDGHIGSTTALVVGDNGTGSLARRALLAAGSIRHGVVKLKITVEFGCNLELADRGLLYALAGVTGHLGAARLVLAGCTSDTLCLEASSSELVPLAKLLRACITSIRETLVAREATQV